MDNLEEYVRKYLEEGYSPKSIKNTLLDEGYSEKEVDAVLNSFEKSSENTQRRRSGDKESIVGKVGDVMVDLPNSTSGDEFDIYFTNKRIIAVKVSSTAKWGILLGPLGYLFSGLTKKKKRGEREDWDVKDLLESDGFDHFTYYRNIEKVEINIGRLGAVSFHVYKDDGKYQYSTTKNTEKLEELFRRFVSNRIVEE